mmetsp:Transcript_19879/g.46516  ORF Transcript_19879/g.46516 Transcript_19879/m.46516 type:complete len:254 (-) Transcript_19879:77-838(-)
MEHPGCLGKERFLWALGHLGRDHHAHGEANGSQNVSLLFQTFLQLGRGVCEPLEGVMGFLNVWILVRVQRTRQLPISVVDVGLAIPAKQRTAKPENGIGHQNTARTRTNSPDLRSRSRDQDLLSCVSRDHPLAQRPSSRHMREPRLIAQDLDSRELFGQAVGLVLWGRRRWRWSPPGQYWRCRRRTWRRRWRPGSRCCGNCRAGSIGLLLETLEDAFFHFRNLHRPHRLWQGCQGLFRHGLSLPIQLCILVGH